MTTSLRLPPPLCTSFQLSPHTSRSTLLLSPTSLSPSQSKTHSIDQATSEEKERARETLRSRVVLIRSPKRPLFVSSSLPPGSGQGRLWIPVKGCHSGITELPPIRNGAGDKNSFPEDQSKSIFTVSHQLTPRHIPASFSLPLSPSRLHVPISLSPNSPFSPPSRKHTLSILKSLTFVQALPPVDPRLLIVKRVALPRRPQCANRKTIVFDLDETLIHCCEEGGVGDANVQMKQPSGHTNIKGIRVRPFVKECLATASSLFEVIVFTASHRNYADPILDFLDPEHTFIHHRLYRQHCLLVGGLYVKDLRILAGRSLSEIVIVDNAVYSFGYQLENGIPINSWREDRTDRELEKLVGFMKMLADAEDVRPLLDEAFRLRSFLLTQ